MTGTMTKLESITVIQNMAFYVRHTLAEYHPLYLSRVMLVMYISHVMSVR